MFASFLQRAPIFLCVVVACLLVSVQSQAPSSFVIETFPWARQETEWYCGDASLQMVYRYLTGTFELLKADPHKSTSVLVDSKLTSAQFGFGKCA